MYNDMLNLIEILQLIFFLCYKVIQDFRELINLMMRDYLIQNKLHNDDLNKNKNHRFENIVIKYELKSIDVQICSLCLFILCSIDLVNFIRSL